MSLSATQRRTLLDIARESIRAVLDGKRPELECDDPELQRPAGVFVTLSDAEGELRGCIGSIEPVAPLFKAVSGSAISAAFRDPRFHPVSPDELGHLSLEISVLGPIVDCTPEEVVPGRDGLIVSKGNRAGLLLPQVATEYGWDRETFLDQTCVKAGLPKGAWRSEGCRLQRFSAEIFNEQAAE
jgi:AmmeMemoRadiSam system protein A